MWSTIMTFSPDTEWIMAWTLSSRWTQLQKMIKRYTTEVHQCQFTCKEDIIVELGLMYKHGTVRVLLISKYESPIFAQKKPNGKLRLLVDLRKFNSLIADDVFKNNHPVRTLSDAAQHLAGKSLFCKTDSSQVYQSLQMVDQRSVELLVFKFASRIFAYKILAEGLSRSLSAFSCFMREYLDTIVKADQCSQYVDDSGIAANNATDLTRNIRAVFKCIRKGEL